MLDQKFIQKFDQTQFIIVLYKQFTLKSVLWKSYFTNTNKTKLLDNTSNCVRKITDSKLLIFVTLLNAFNGFE